MRVTTAVITVLALAAVPCFAANGGATAGRAGGIGAAATMHQVPPGQQMKQEMMPTPAHLLLRAFHRNVANFAQTLYQAADQGPVVPAPLARTAVSEMRRSVDEMEKQRATALGAMRLPPERQKMMDEHLVQVKTHLRQLEELVQKERIDSGVVKKELQSIFAECDGAGCGARPSAGWGCQGKGPYGGRAGCDCPKGNPDHAMMMDDMMEKVKSQDTELAQLVQRMRQADGQAKLDLVAETVATMVQQRAELTAEMQKMHDMMEAQHPGPYQMMMNDDEDQGEDEEYDFEDVEEVTAD